jgi:hypothetical protein
MISGGDAGRRLLVLHGGTAVAFFMHVETAQVLWNAGNRNLEGDATLPSLRMIVPLFSPTPLSEMLLMSTVNCLGDRYTPVTMRRATEEAARTRRCLLMVHQKRHRDRLVPSALRQPSTFSAQRPTCCQEQIVRRPVCD